MSGLFGALPYAVRICRGLQGVPGVIDLISIAHFGIAMTPQSRQRQRLSIVRYPELQTTENG